MRVTGLDLSLTGSGVATIETDVEDGWRQGPRTDITLREFGTKPTLTDLTSRAERIRTVATKVIRACDRSDVVAVEDMFTGRGTGAELDRAGLWWIVVNSLTTKGIPVVPITNNHVKMWALGKGGGAGTDKAHMLAATIRRYPDVNITSDNTCDALNLAAITAHHYGHPLVDMPATNLRALAGVRWPTLTRMEGTA